jgi:hypothetical protein
MNFNLQEGKQSGFWLNLFSNNELMKKQGENIRIDLFFNAKAHFTR